MRVLKTILITLLILITPVFVFAQSGEELDIIVSPKSPGANEEVSMTVISTSPGLNNASITWSKNGTVERRGVGEIKHKTSVGNLGKSTVINVSVTKDDGKFLQKSIDLRPADVYLIWEADSYTPMFYRGKALPAHQSSIRVIAIPELLNTSGVKFGSNNLFFEWSLDGKIDRSQSGFGQNVFNFKGSLISKPRTVSVFVRTSGGSVTARKNTEIRFYNPSIIVYRENPLTGIKSSASLTEGFVQKNESTFVVEPYFFPKTLVSSDSLDYKWVVDGVELENSDKRKRVTFSSESVGESSVLVEIINPVSLLQRAKSLFKVISSND